MAIYVLKYTFATEFINLTYKYRQTALKKGLIVFINVPLIFCLAILA